MPGGQEVGAHALGPVLRHWHGGERQQAEAVAAWQSWAQH